MQIEGVHSYPPRNILPVTAAEKPVGACLVCRDAF
jgi:hypothetical protein